MYCKPRFEAVQNLLARAEDIPDQRQVFGKRLHKSFADVLCLRHELLLGYVFCRRAQCTCRPQLPRLPSNAVALSSRDLGWSKWGKGFLRACSRGLRQLLTFKSRACLLITLTVKSLSKSWANVGRTHVCSKFESWRCSHAVGATSNGAWPWHWPCNLDLWMSQRGKMDKETCGMLTTEHIH